MYCLRLQGNRKKFTWVPKWLGRKECVGYMGKLEEMWAIRAIGGGEGANRSEFQEWPFLWVNS